MGIMVKLKSELYEDSILTKQYAVVRAHQQVIPWLMDDGILHL
jgi:hypothetical protein